MMTEAVRRSAVFDPTPQSHSSFHIFIAKECTLSRVPTFSVGAVEARNRHEEMMNSPMLSGA